MRSGLFMFPSKLSRIQCQNQ